MIRLSRQEINLRGARYWAGTADVLQQVRKYRLSLQIQVCVRCAFVKLSKKS